MANRLKKNFYRLMAGANAVTILFLVVVSYAGHLNPAQHPYAANLGLLFPFFLAVNTAFLAFWAIFHIRMIWIPFTGFLLCLGPTRAYCPLNASGGDTLNTIKVVSYNVCTFMDWVPDQTHPIVQYLNDQRADIVCLQELGDNKRVQSAVLQQLEAQYPHNTVMKMGQGSVTMAVLSRYPILSWELIPYPSDHNLSAAIRLKIGSDTVTVINNHFETVGLSLSDKQQFEGIVQGTTRGDSAKAESKLLVGKVAAASKIRSRQVRTVGEYIERHRSEPLICCGDFNDDPLSYSRRTIGKLLTDCYIAAGRGPGWSFYTNKMYVRIDNIFCSGHFKPVTCKVDSRYKYSDHYPIICRLKYNGKAEKE